MMKQKKFDGIREDTRWKYTYHQRFTAYPFIDIEGKSQTVDQINSVMKKLEGEPLSKSAQATTWDPRWDHNDKQMGEVWDDYHSPCLQRLWFRLVPDGEGYRMNLNTHWRSRDHFKAVPQNIYAVTEVFQKQVGGELEKRLDVPVSLGRYVDVSDSLHLYGHYYDIEKQGRDAQMALEGIFKAASIEPFEDRLILPGSDMHDMMVESVKEEYDFRVANPMFGSGQK
jgi:thymidylate synthase